MVMETLCIESTKQHNIESTYHMEKEKIVFVIQGLIKGGAEFFLINLINRLVKREIQPTVVVLSDDIPMIGEIDPAIRTYVLTRKFRYDLSISKKIARIIQDEGAQKVFCVGPFCFFLTKLGLLQSPEIKFYLSLHSTVPFSFKEQVFDTLYLKFMRKTDETIFICQNQKAYYATKFQYRPVRATVVYNGIDTDFAYSPDSREMAESNERIRQELGIPAQERLILKVANIRKEKGHLYAINALGILQTQYATKAHLVFVGWCPDDYSQELERATNLLGLAKYVHFVGPQTDVKPYLAAANIFTLTSYSVETFSIAALEAMAFGLPCSLTEIGGAAEMIEPRKTGLLSIPRDEASIAKTWHELLNQRYDRDYIRNYVKSKFSSEKTALAYRQVLSKVSYEKESVMSEYS
jgi:glycosyltransferase involved in cell wall biosynthesis